VRQIEADAASGLIGKKEAKSMLARPRTLDIEPVDEAVKGFVDDLSAHTGSDPKEFLDAIHVAPPAEKAWQIAGRLMADSPLQQLDTDKYRDAREQLSRSDRTAGPAASSSTDPWARGCAPDRQRRGADLAEEARGTDGTRAFTVPTCTGEIHRHANRRGGSGKCRTVTSN
jgi:hypothetical protein